MLNFPPSRRSALEKWKQRQGGEATYRNLIGVFEYAGHKLLADTVHKLASKYLSSDYSSFS